MPAVYICTSPRITAALLLGALVLLPGCEDDECNLELFYTVGSDSYHQQWFSPTAECSYGYGIESGELSYEYKELGIHATFLDLNFGVGSHDLELRFVDAAGTTWYSAEADGQIQSSGCVAQIYDAETVDWVRNDHLRLTGIIACTGPLIDSSFPDGSLDGVRQLTIDELKFSIYAAKGGLLY